MDLLLPEEFLHKMKAVLSDEFDEYKADLSKPYYRGIRVNTLKIDVQHLKNILDIHLKPSPFCKDGFYIPFETKGLGNTPLHHAGAFYMQEPSAGSAVTMLDIKKGDKVLDLCAAPGGKSTQAAAALDGTGLLWSNEIVKNRANILLSNIERMGIKNAVVSSCHPELLCEKLHGFFDKVLVDAPCSGEGMFRKDEKAVSDWSEQHVKTCAVRQRSVLQSASKAVKPGGVLVYSTCTFSYEENENVIEQFLKDNPDFILAEANVTFGRPAMEKARRILPMDGGEGHFAAKLKKIDGDPITAVSYDYSSPFSGKNKSLRDMVYSLYDELFRGRPFGERFSVAGDRLILLPEYFPDFSGLHILRAGVLFGEIKKNRIEPAHAAFMAAGLVNIEQSVTLDRNSEEICRFLRGEEVAVPEHFKGYTAVCVNGIVTGFGKCSSGTLKNKYPKGLRNL